MSRDKLFVLVPNAHRLGGVANYFRVIKKYLPKRLEYIRRGESKKNESSLLIPFRIIYDYLKFCYQYWFQDGSLLINTSLGGGNFLRDGIYMFLSSKKNTRIVFFHGWKHTFADKIDDSWFLKFWLVRTFLKADHIIVLSSDFKRKLKEWGYNNSLSVETTIVEEGLISDESWKGIQKVRRQTDCAHILYLSGMIKAKGIWEIAESFKILNSTGKLGQVKITMAGEGVEKDALQKFVQVNKIDVEFPGYVQGKQKKNVFKKATLFIFASYSEGMPTAVLEAMAFGLPIITTPVGGIPDFFEDGKMGLTLEKVDPVHIAGKIDYLMERPKLMRKMSKYNYEYAQNNFYAGEVANRMKHIIDNEAGR